MTVSEIEEIKKLQELYEIFNRKYYFKPGDIVEYKPGMQHKVSCGPFIVVEILDKPIATDKEEPLSPYFNDTLDIILGQILKNDSGENVLINFHHDSRRFQPIGWTESEKQNMQ